MDWDAIGAIGEILGAAAVIISIVYLASQVRESNRAARNAAETEYQVRWNAMCDHMWNSNESANRTRRGYHDLALLTPDERTVFFNQLGKMVDVQRIGMRMHEKGLLADDLYEAGNNAVAFIMKTAGARDWWQTSRDFYIHRDFIEELMARDHGPISENPFFSFDPEAEVTDSEGGLT